MYSDNNFVEWSSNHFLRLIFSDFYTSIAHVVDFYSRSAASDGIDENAIVEPYCVAPNGLFPHPTNCGLFILCGYGRGCIMECPHTLHFSPELRICTWPEEAQCSIGKATLIRFDVFFVYID